jgi:hypothetical protein
MFKRILILSIIIILLAGCSPKAAATPSPLYSNAPGEIIKNVTSQESAGLDTASTGQTSAAGQRIVIKNASLNIIVAKADTSMDNIRAMTEEMGGFVVTADLVQYTLEDGTEVPRGSITIRVPAERLDEALTRIKQETDLPIENEKISSQDVTSEYTDLQSRLRNLEATDSQLNKFMESATTTADVLAVYQELTRIREQIELLKGQIQYYDQSAKLSSISVTLIPKESIQPITIGRWQPVGVARNAIQALINTLKVLIVILIYLVILIIPVLLVIFGPLYLIWRGISRLRKRKKVAVQPMVDQTKS